MPTIKTIIAASVLLAASATTSLASTLVSAATVVVAIDADEAEAVRVVREALRSPDPLARTAAARVAAVRNLVTLVVDIRTALDSEEDATAAREEIRAYALLAGEASVREILELASPFPISIDADAALAVARRDGALAVDLFITNRTALRASPNWSDFFRLALWHRPDLVAPTSSKVLGTGDADRWKALLLVSREASVAIPGGIVFPALRSNSEEIRVATVWYLVRGYAPDPSRLPDLLAEPLKSESDSTTDREEFGRELLRRMLGVMRREEQRWLSWLDSAEADEFLGLEDERSVSAFLTDAELAVREKRCKVLPMQCPIRKGETRIPSVRVADPEFQLPAVLPAGLADAIVKGSGCARGWLALASATVDGSGRVQQFEVDRKFLSGSCLQAAMTISRLSLVNPTDLRTSRSARNILLVKAGKRSACLDEDAPSDHLSQPARRIDQQIRPPVVKRRVEPIFPRTAVSSMGPNRSVLVILEAVISKTGCIRSLRLVEQSPFPELNRAAIEAMAQWTFAPALLDGEPVDVIFNLTVTFRVPM